MCSLGLWPSTLQPQGLHKPTFYLAEASPSLITERMDTGSTTLPWNMGKESWGWSRGYHRPRCTHNAPGCTHMHTRSWGAWEGSGSP